MVAQALRVRVGRQAGLVLERSGGPTGLSVATKGWRPHSSFIPSSGPCDLERLGPAS